MDQEGLNDFAEALYNDLHRIAGRHLRAERSDHTLQTTALLHEAYLKLAESAQGRFKDKTHFLAIASRVMRQVLVDHARARATHKRGGQERRIASERADLDLVQVAPRSTVEPLEILELNRGLEALAREDADLAQIIELRYFGGMTAEEMSESLGRSVHVVRHDLRLALAWLRRELSAHK